MDLVRLKHKGQVTLPAGVRKQLHLQDGDMLRVRVRKGQIVMEPALRGHPVAVPVPVSRLRRMAGVVSLGGDAAEDTSGLYDG